MKKPGLFALLVLALTSIGTAAATAQAALSITDKVETDAKPGSKVATGTAPIKVIGDEPPSTLRVGTFDSRFVALAYYRSEHGMKAARALQEELQEAREAKDKKRLKELEGTVKLAVDPRDGPQDLGPDANAMDYILGSNWRPRPQVDSTVGGHAGGGGSRELDVLEKPTTIPQLDGRIREACVRGIDTTSSLEYYCSSELALSLTTMSPEDSRLLIQKDAKSGVPFYRQIIEQIKFAIARGQLNPGDRLPTVRQLAVDLSVDPNTVVRAYRELELEQVIETQQGSGTYVGKERLEIDPLEHQRMLDQILTELLARASSYGFSLDDILKGLRRRKEVSS